MVCLQASADAALQASQQRISTAEHRLALSQEELQATGQQCEQLHQAAAAAEVGRLVVRHTCNQIQGCLCMAAHDVTSAQQSEFRFEFSIFGSAVI